MPFDLLDGRAHRRVIVRCLAASTLAGLMTTTGCQNTAGKVASMNPFDKSNEVSVASAKKGDSSNFMTGWFKKKKDTTPRIVVAADQSDPTSLAHQGKVTPEILIAHGRVCESVNDFEKAMNDYQRALEMDPENGEAWARLARLHYRLKDHAQAIESFGHALKQLPDDASLHNDLALSLSAIGNHQAAAQALDQAVKLKPRSSRYSNNLASVKFKNGDAQGALEVLVKNNKPAVAHFNIAYLHHKHGQSREALRHLNSALTYESTAAEDPAIEVAVKRSRELMQQIEATGAVTNQGVVSQQGWIQQPAATSTAAANTAATSPVAATSPAARIAQNPAVTGTSVQPTSHRTATAAPAGTQLPAASGASSAKTLDLPFGN